MLLPICFSLFMSTLTNVFTFIRRLPVSVSTIFVIVLFWPVLHLMARTTSNQPYNTNIKNYIIYHTLIILYWWKVCEDYLYPTMDWSCNPGVAVALTFALFAALPLVQVGSWPPLLRGMFFWSSQVFWWAVYKLRLKIASSVKPAQDQQSHPHQLEDVETWKRLLPSLICQFSRKHCLFSKDLLRCHCQASIALFCLFTNKTF